MAETPATGTETTATPKMICEKCRNEYPLEQFQHGLPELGCVCRRCLSVMGYRVK